ncbi:MAG: Tad domain-containing protein [Phycisphaerales bacterium]|nr:MAG: Tad domain-containing protein [Phycisphaerales bacterium]
MMRRASSRRRGATVAVLAVSLTAILGMAALVIDLGHIYNCRTEMQNAVDASALAGASGLHISNTEARERAVASAASNTLATEAVALGLSDVEIGNWEWSSRSFTPIGDEPQEHQPNATRVIGRKQGLALFFARIFGRHTTGILRDAIALADSGRCRGIWWLEGIVANGDVITDSYDSRDGTYETGVKRANGDICSNESIVVNGGVNVRGDAMYGPGGDLTINGVANEIWGITGETCCAVDPPVVDATEASVTNNNDTIGLWLDGCDDRGCDGGGDPVPGPADRLNLVADETVTLSGGTYYCSAAKVLGLASIRVTGPSVVYIDGNATLGGAGIINETGDPKNLIIYCTGTQVSFTGTSDFYGAIVAPDADIVLQGTADYYGTVIGQTLTMLGDFVVHVDEAVVADLLGGDGDVAPILVE